MIKLTEIFREASEKSKSQFNWVLRVITLVDKILEVAIAGRLYDMEGALASSTFG
jgi:hypothetical protein